jgi:hypothetical protein
VEANFCCFLLFFHQIRPSRSQAPGWPSTLPSPLSSSYSKATCLALPHAFNPGLPRKNRETCVIRMAWVSLSPGRLYPYAMGLCNPFYQELESIPSLGIWIGLVMCCGHWNGVDRTCASSELKPPEASCASTLCENRQNQPSGE